MEYFLTTFIICFCITFFVRRIAILLRLTTDSSDKSHPAHTHQGVLPRAGGLAIAISIILAMLLFLNMNKLLYAIVGGISVLIVVGLIDDKINLSPYVRLILNFIAAGIAILGGLGIPYISNPFGSPISLIQPQIVVQIFGTHTIWILADLFALFWLVSLMNVINWSKGVDGQLPGYTAVAAIFMSIVAIRFSGHEISVSQSQTLGLITAGAFAGFLPWNFYPQKILPGYSGGSLAGYMLGVLSILAFGKVGALLIILSVPLTDGIYIVLRRIREGRNPFRGDNKHLHHMLLRRGWGRRRISVFYIFITAIFGFCSIVLQSPLSKVIGVAMVYSFLMIWLYLLEREDIKS